MLAHRFGIHRAMASLGEGMGEEPGAILAQQDRAARQGGDVVGSEPHGRFLSLWMAMLAEDLDKQGERLQIFAQGRINWGGGEGLEGLEWESHLRWKSKHRAARTKRVPLTSAVQDEGFLPAADGVVAEKEAQRLVLVNFEDGGADGAGA